MRKLKSKARVYAFDLDGILTNESGIPNFPNKSNEEIQQFYRTMTPNESNIEYVQQLYSTNEVFIKIFTARSDYHHNTTVEWLQKHNVPYDRLIFNKEYYDVFIDDHAYNSYEDFLMGLTERLK